MIEFAVVLLRLSVDRARALRAEPASDRGASALEWAIIAGVVVVAASVIGGVVYNIVTTKGTALQNCANQPVGTACK